jgi:hypothetical protein
VDLNGTPFLPHPLLQFEASPRGTLDLGAVSSSRCKTAPVIRLPLWRRRNGSAMCWRSRSQPPIVRSYNLTEIAGVAYARLTSRAKRVTHPSLLARYSAAISEGLNPSSRQARIFSTATCNSPSAVDAVKISGAGPDRSAMSRFGLTALAQQAGKVYRVGVIFTTTPVSEKARPEPVQHTSERSYTVCVPSLC